MMETEFWHARWEQGLIGWHQEEVNPHLERFWPRLALDAGAKVFVPLCGKSLDLLWLARAGYEVIGVEVSATAVATLFRDNELNATVSSLRDFQVWRGEGLRIFQGDFFCLRAADLAGVAAIYDRASLIAFPPQMRPGYVDHLMGVTPDAGAGLLITLEYDSGEMQGPPFSVSEDEVNKLLGSRVPLRRAYEFDALAANPRFQARGLSSLTERVYTWSPS